MTVIISVFFLTEKHKAFSKDLGIVSHVSFWLLIKKKKKPKWVTAEQIPRRSLQKAAPALLGVRQWHWFMLFSPAKPAPGWSPLAGHYRSDHWDTARPMPGIQNQGRKSHCYSWRYSLCPERWEENPARSACEHVHRCRALSFHAAWHDLIPPLEKKDPWETRQVSQCPSCYFITCSSSPPVGSVSPTWHTMWWHWQLPFPTSSSIFSCLSESPALKTPQLPTHTKHSQSHPSMIHTFVVARINVPWQDFDQLELEQNHTSQRKVMLQTTQPLPVIGCK